MFREVDVLIIGAGVVGVVIARELSKYDVKVLLLEKEPDVGWGQSKASFGIRHPGSRWTPGSLAQRMIYESQKMWEKLIDELEIDFRITGEIVVAFNDEEVEYIRALKAQGEKNGVEGLEILGRKDTLEMEPHLNPNVKAALFKKKAGVFDPFSVVFAFYENALANGVEAYLDTVVTGIVFEKDKFIVVTNRGDFTTKYVVNAAGLYAQHIAQLIGDGSFKISYETKSTCIILDKLVGKTINHIIAGIPDVKSFLRFKLVMPTYHQNLLIYTAIPEPSKSIDDRSVEKRALEITFKEAEFLVPGLDLRKYVITAFSGLTARNNRGDFIIETSPKHPRFINVALLPGGLTAVPAVAKRVVEIIESTGFHLVKKTDFNPTRKAITRIRDLHIDKMQDVLSKNPLYGKIICRCEKVSEAEIVEAIKRGATTLDGVKFRTRAGMGRCQSNFCGCEIAEIISRELGLPYEKVTKKGDDSYFVVGKEGE